MTPKLLKASRELVDAMCPHQCVLVCGSPCTGKSTLIKSTLEALLWASSARPTLVSDSSRAVLPDVPTEARAHIVTINADALTCYELRDRLQGLPNAQVLRTRLTLELVSEAMSRMPMPCRVVVSGPSSFNAAARELLSELAVDNDSITILEA